LRRERAIEAVEPHGPTAAVIVRDASSRSAAIFRRLNDTIPLQNVAFNVILADKDQVELLGTKAERNCWEDSG
jgi:hypothetical protein